MSAMISLVGCALAAYPEHPAFINPGTPGGVPPSYDCTVREHAWEFGKSLLPSRGGFRTLFDALQLGACGLTPPSQDEKEWMAPKWSKTSSDGLTFFCDANVQKSGDGSIGSPFKTIAEALAAVEKRPSSSTPAMINLRKGTFYLSDQLVLTKVHSNLVIQNYNGEDVTVSGGVPLTTPKDSWKPDSIIKEHWETYTDFNTVDNIVESQKNKTDIKYVGTFGTIDACSAAVMSSSENFQSYSYFNDAQAPWKGQCFASISSFWAPTAQKGVTSSRRVKSNRWSIDLSNQPGLGNVLGLRVNNNRAIRAKYPNGDPEQSGTFYQPSQDYTTGWTANSRKTKWARPIPPKSNSTTIVVTADDWPGTEWPMTQEGGSTWTGEGQWGEFHVGVGGYCSGQGIDPPVGYWCAMDAPRGANLYYRSPSGLSIEGTIPQAVNYSNPKGAVVQSWRAGGRWYSNLCQVDRYDAASKTLIFDTTTGCNNGGEGTDGGAQWWIENVLEECDDDNEFYFDQDTKTLYYNFNGTSGPTGNEEFVAVQTKVLFNISATQQEPAQNIKIQGLVIRDAALTYLGHTAADIHSPTTGGDWSLQRSAAVMFEGCEGCGLSHSQITRVDGNAVIVSNYNRNVSITNNDMSWIGDNAIATWGSTSKCLNKNCTKSIPYPRGPDARGGNQPWHTLIQGNVVREVGIFEKQSSFYTHVAAGYTILRGNVHFNGPRAGVNFMDGMMGGDLMEGNLLTNCVRESGDHGPFNSWDRIPYIINNGMHRVFNKDNVTGDMPGHVLADGPSILSQYRTIRKNFIIGVYNSQEAIDNDDGSCHYLTHDNYFAFAEYGLKSDFGGQWNHHYNNVYAYVGGCYGTGNNDAFYNNLCQTRGDGGYKSTCFEGCPPSFTIRQNRVHNPSGTVKFCAGDVNSTVSTWLSDKDLDAEGTNAMKPWPMSMEQ
eukprot:TRINITY_DN12821_c0_g1_i1.p1 TRINITY_DN12821_c0_g1~~TRINITY_DN12821_c0_g1_i1.p1  ORF type:complete len:937 (+),score=210.86 TRINITY_DN12821_c0_g1_i1:61-2871(+)